MAIEENVSDEYYRDEDRELYDKSQNKEIYNDKIKQYLKKKVPYHEVEFLHDIVLKLSARFGRSNITIHELLGLKENSICIFDKNVGDPVDIVIGGRIMARGEIVIVNERFGVRISEITRPE